MDGEINLGERLLVLDGTDGIVNLQLSRPALVMSHRIVGGVGIHRGWP
jgi:hypothetical protein